MPHFVRHFFDTYIDEEKAAKGMNKEKKQAIHNTIIITIITFDFFPQQNFELLVISFPVIFLFLFLFLIIIAIF